MTFRHVRVHVYVGWSRFTQCTPITPRSGGMVPPDAACRYLQRARTIPLLPGVMGVQCAFFVLGYLDR